jgi:chromosomal replication initiation ATPase DnaA
MKSRSRPDEIMQHIKIILAGNEKLAWQLGVYLSPRYSGMKLKEIGEIFGMRESAICEATRRIRARIERDSVLRQQVETIREGLKT